MVGVGGVSQSQSFHNVFVYGSLMADEVVRVLLHRVPQTSSAILNGFHRYSIKGRVYPAILPVENKKVSGRVLMGITDPELNILDEFEDDEYERSTVEVSLLAIIKENCRIALRVCWLMLTFGATKMIQIYMEIGILRNGDEYA